MSDLDSIVFEFAIDGEEVSGFVKVLDIFEHHFTGETMRQIRVDYMDEDGKAATYTDILNEEEYKLLVAKRIKKGE